ncbi:MAG: AsmA family protein [Phycisphaerales bacterium]|nr:AsmA family protein [Phycisphaerales bacterium]
MAGSLGKSIRRTLGVIILLVLVVIVILLFSIDGIIRKAVAIEGAKATQTQVTLGDASLSILNGKLGLGNLTIASPSGYADPQLLSLGYCGVQVNTGSLLGSTIVVPSIKINDLKVYIDQKGTSNNLQQVMNNLQSQPQATAGTGAAPASASSSSGRSLKINDILLTNTQVSVTLEGLPGIKPTTLSIPIPKIEIANPTNPNGRPMKIADVISQVLGQIAQSVAKDPRLPAGLRSGLSDASKMLTQGAQGALTGIKAAATQQINKGVGNALHNLLGGNK